MGRKKKQITTQETTAVVALPEAQPVSLNDKTKDIIDNILKAESKDELTNLYQEFNIQNTKKNAIRINELNNLLDKINKEAIDRFENRPGEIGHKELIDYMNAVQNQIDRSQKIVDNTPNLDTLNVSNTNISINVGKEVPDGLQGLSKESRNKITDFINSILSVTNAPTVVVPDNCMPPNEDTIEEAEVIEDTETVQNGIVSENVNKIIDPDDEEFAGDD